MLIPLILFIIAILLFIYHLNTDTSSPVPGLNNPLKSAFLSILSRNDIISFFGSCFKQYGQTFQFVTPFIGRSLFTTSPENVDYIVNNLSKYKRMVDSKRDSLQWRLSKYLIGQGIFLSDDLAWKLQRTAATPMFSRKSLENNMLPTFIRHGHELVSFLKTFEKHNESVDAQDVFMRLTMDTFGEIAFGEQFGTLHEYSNKKNNESFSFQFDSAQKRMFLFFMIPISAVFDKQSFFGNVKNVNKYIYDLISKKRSVIQSTSSSSSTGTQNDDKNGDGDLEKGDDLLSKFLLMKDVNGNNFPEPWIRDVIVNFLLAGRDTTGLLLTWTFYLLSCNPEVRQKVLQEIDSVIPDGEEPSVTNLKELRYLDNVLKETLRLMPSVPHTGRFAAQDDVLPDGSVVKAGDHIRYSQYFMHRNEKYWDRPNEFDPDRWNDKNIIKHPYQYIPFHGGPMRCMGEKMALLEAKAIIAIVSQKLILEHDKSHNIDPFFGIVMTSNSGMTMKIQTRK
eukprot:TRINITY_DN709_c0_g4_i1.p1 TRINITY_DN709_c0_g4~~TRINITY_DN709_c0_g4_i1.p1  ORF type:complete len:505 (-),score=131.09 TRINITY_DN709_c0_g4_i1:162-1676(-)